MTAAAAALLAAVFAVAAPPPAVEGPLGTGASQVWILRPSGPVRSIVVFGHGWKSSPPATTRQWLDQFAPWLKHLVAGGSAVVFPRYQLGGDAQGAPTVTAYRAGLEAAFARLPSGVPVVVAGYSYGAVLGVAYAANARAWSLPRPVALDAIFPALLVAGVPLPPLAPRVAALVQVGDRDTDAGTGGARQIWAWLKGHVRRRYEVVASRDGFVAVHAAPKLATAAARRAFWSPLDALIAAGRR